MVRNEDKWLIWQELEYVLVDITLGQMQKLPINTVFPSLLIEPWCIFSYMVVIADIDVYKIANRLKIRVSLYDVIKFAYDY